MTAYIQSMLFMNNNNYDIDDVRDLMLTVNFKKYRIPNNQINKIPEEPIESTEIKINNSENQTQNDNSNYITPKQKDSLFWCIYIAKYGYNDYRQINKNYGSKQLDEQKKIGQHIKQNLHLLKNTNTRITKAAGQEILSDLLTDTKKTEMNVLYAYCIYYGFNLIIMNEDETTYIEIVSNTFSSDNPTYLMNKNKKDKYSIIEEPINKDEYVNITSNKFKLDSHIRPLKAISNYKIDELRIIADQIGIDIYEQKWLKPDLYKSITAKLSWY
jgi:hypothetical protein